MAMLGVGLFFMGGGGIETDELMLCKCEWLGLREVGWNVSLGRGLYGVFGGFVAVRKK